MRKIKILRIITRLNIGGPAIHACLLTRELNEPNNAEFETKLICGSVSPGEGDMRYFAEEHGVEPLYVPALRREINPFRDLAAFFGILNHMREYKPDIVHTHTAKAGMLGRFAAILTNAPVKIHTFHGNIFYGYFSKISTRIFMVAEKFLARFTDTIIAISRKQEDDVVRKYRITTPKKCHVIKLGFNLERFLSSKQKTDVFRKKFNFSKDEILIGMIGRLTAIKNHRMFIDVADYLNKTAGKDINGRMRFVIVGDGELKNRLFEYTRSKGLEERIFFTGWVRQVEEVYAGLDIVALTSINEGTPVSLIEAMSSARPVVATDVGGVRDAVGEAGVLVKSGDYKAMGDTILKLAGSAEEREKLGSLGRNSVRDLFSKERLVSELRGLYKEELSKKTGENTQ